MDISAAIQARSDQLNADDLTSAGTTITITHVEPGTQEQPVNVYTAEYGEERPYKPSKGMLRIMGEAWGKDTDAWHGQSLIVFRDPDVKWGGAAVGGIRIKAMTGLDKPRTFAVTIARGKKKAVTIQPLTANRPPSPAQQALAAFQALGIDQAHLEGRIGKPMTEWVQADVAALKNYYQQVTTTGEIEGESA